MMHFVRHYLCSCGSPECPLKLGIMSQYLADIFQTCMWKILHTEKVPYAWILDCANMAQIACKIVYFVSVNHFQLWHRQWTPSTQFFLDETLYKSYWDLSEGIWVLRIDPGAIWKNDMFSTGPPNNILYHR